MTEHDLDPRRVDIRTLAHCDLDAVMAIEEIAFPTIWSRESYEQEVARSRTDGWCRVAVMGGGVVGYLVAWFVLDEAHLAKVAVDPGCRRRGIARRLVGDLLDAARRRGMRRVELEVRMGNAEAVALYRSLDFLDVGRRPGYYRDGDRREDARLMRLPLDPASPEPPPPGSPPHGGAAGGDSRL